MVNLPKKSLELVISAIKNMQERKGSSCRTIVNYVSSLCDVPRDIAQRQVLAALKRGTIHGILRETDGYYSLPTGASSEHLEVARQELGLLDLSCRKRKQEARKRKSSVGCGGSKKTMRKKSRRGRSRRRKASKGRKPRGCGSARGKRRKRTRKRSRRGKSKSKSKYNCGPGKSRRSKRRRSKKRNGKKNKSCECPSKVKLRAPKSDKCGFNFVDYIGRRELEV
ncbi:calcium homeostasis endoplasmic reticulum protein-like [Diachasmimorpha longicaudata]|uniref:calcium homeostasis endoplasmic reticulum protein-like n=1 Tax=Diachasmimorpha longicaudata TaxID=58733 RepID=UPI0030B8D096